MDDETLARAIGKRMVEIASPDELDLFDEIVAESETTNQMNGHTLAFGGLIELGTPISKLLFEAAVAILAVVGQTATEAIKSEFSAIAREGAQRVRRSIVAAIVGDVSGSSKEIGIGEEAVAELILVCSRELNRLGIDGDKKAKILKNFRIAVVRE